MTADTKQQNPQFDSMSNASSCTCGMDTPPTATETVECPASTESFECPTPTESSECLWSDHGTVPWPGNTYHIIEKQSGKAITLIGDQVRLRNLRYPRLLGTHWLCIKQVGYFGFQNPKTGGYLGHDGGSGIHTSALGLKEWELWTPREHPDGGYELLPPYWTHTLMVLAVHGDMSTLTRRHHGTTLWEFVKV